MQSAVCSPRSANVIHQTERFLDCVHFFSAWARQAVIQSIAVVYELTKRTQEMLFADGAH